MVGEINQTLHMVGGLGGTSYASNSYLQEKAMSKAKSVVQESVSEVYRTLLPSKLLVADLGCSSGPNTFTAISEITVAVSDACRILSHKPPPEIMFFLNDLPGNDFNNIFRTLTWYEKKLKEEQGDRFVPYYVAGVPGSFYGRLFPEESIHFLHSSYSLHWLSQVPQGLQSNMSVPMNRGNIYIATTSPPSVFESYLKQFQHDFSSFLKLRSKEIISGGQMVLTFIGRSNLQQIIGEVCYVLGLLADALNTLVSEGLVEEAKVDAFNLPMFAPAMEEVKAVVLSEGSFEFYQEKTFKINWDPFDDSDDESATNYFESGKNVAKNIRAVMEPIFAAHFGKDIIDTLFSRYRENVSQHLQKEKTKYVNFTIVLKRRG